MNPQAGNNPVRPNAAWGEYKLFALACALAMAIFFVDLNLPLGVAGGVPYVAVVLIGWWLPHPRQIILIAALAAALTVIGYFFSPSGGIQWVVLVNRGMALFVILVSAALLFLVRKTSDTLKKNETLLRESEERFRGVIDHSPSFITLKDLDGKFLLANKTHTEIFGISSQDIIGKTCFDFFPKKIAESISAQDRKVIETKSVVVEEREFPTLKGNRFYIVAKFPILNRFGAVMGIGTIGTDIAERKKWERDLVTVKEEAEKSNLAKSEFLSSMSHELRTPLNAILGFTQLLNTDRDNPLTEGQVDATEQVLKSGDHLLSLIDEVLDLAQIESGNVALHAGPQDPTPVIDSCATIAGNLAEQKGLEFYDRTQSWNLPEISIDETRFRQVLLNLLSNAVKYNRDGGTVTLSVEEAPQGALRLSVIDTGIGIAEDKQAQIFTPFSRLGLENSDITGTGIGLTITKKLTEAMGGRIGFESTHNLGSTFWLEFPIAGGRLSVKDRGEKPAADAAVAAVGDNDDAAANVLSVAHTVLCVEDNPSSLKLMETLIGRIPGTMMISAHTGELGIDLAEIHRPDVIMMDINLPGMDGMEALRRLKASTATKDIPVIALTARASARDKEQGLDAGFEHFLTKPINVKEVTKAIESSFRA